MRLAAAVSVVVAAACAGCGGGAHRGAAPAAPAATAPPAAAPGRALFVAHRCGSCHALHDAHARGGVGPDLDTSEPLTRPQILQSLIAGANGMPSYARLSRRDRRRLADYLLAVAWKRSPARIGG
jgi:cbb3-type cytochrome c oxidase subunit III